MANNYSTDPAFSGKLAPADPAYPLGKAQNVTAPGDGTGTPWLASLVNDFFGAQQALLSASGVTASGTPDNADVSQYLEALQKLNGRQVFTADGTFNTPAWVKRIKVTCVGGGGGGANSTASFGGNAGGGGGAAQSWIVDPAASYSVTVGAGGIGAAASSGGSATGGTASEFGASLVVGAPGNGGSTTAYVGGLGGLGTGEVLLPGVTGGGGFESSRCGYGGNSLYGRGGQGGRSTDQAGSNGQGYGAAGGGGNGTGKGGDGVQGVVIVEWGIGI